MVNSQQNRVNEAIDIIAMNKIIFVLFVASAISSSTIQALRIACNQPNEEYQCGSACQTTCENLGLPCPIVNIKCNDGCYCINGYARNKAGTCIPIAKCPKKCKSSEESSESRSSSEESSEKC